MHARGFYRALPKTLVHPILTQASVTKLNILNGTAITTQPCRAGIMLLTLRSRDLFGLRWWTRTIKNLVQCTYLDEEKQGGKDGGCGLKSRVQ